MDIVGKAKDYCLNIIEHSYDIYDLDRHLPEAERWAKKIMQGHPEADQEVVLLIVWLHDVSHYVGDKGTDHAVRSEKMAKEFLEKNNYDPKKMKKVLHGVRSHRNRDVIPESIEAKIFACADSASHMTDICYLDIAQTGRFKYLSGKVERDYRDVSLFPEIQKLLSPLHESWKELIKNYEMLHLTEPVELAKDELGFN